MDMVPSRLRPERAEPAEASHKGTVARLVPTNPVWHHAAGVIEGDPEKKASADVRRGKHTEGITAVVK